MLPNYLIEFLQLLNDQESFFISEKVESDTNLSLDEKRDIKLLMSLKDQYLNPISQLEVSVESNFNDKLRNTYLTYNNCIKLLSQYNMTTYRKGLDPNVIALNNVNDKISISKLLHSRGGNLIRDRLINDVIRTSEKFELFEQLIYALGTKLKIHYNVDQINEGLILMGDYEKAIKSFYLLKTSRLYYHPYDINESRETYKNYEEEEILKKIILVCQFYKQTGSKKIYSILLFFQLHYCHSNNCLGIYSGILKNFKSIIKMKLFYTKKRVVFFQIKEIEYSIRCLNFENFKYNGLSFSILRSDYLKNGSYNLLLSRFNLLFYNLKFNEINKYKKSQLKNWLIKRNKLTSDKLSFTMCACIFLQNEFKNALSMLNELEELRQDKAGWNVAIRILRIMIYIEMEKFDLVDDEIESFRKYMERNAKKGNIHLRDQMILKSFQKLKIRAYDFIVFEEKHQDIMDELSKVDGPCAWEISMHEKVLFHIWLKAKIKGENYIVDYEPYRKFAHEVSMQKEKELKARPDYDQLGFELTI